MQDYGQKNCCDYFFFYDTRYTILTGFVDLYFIRVHMCACVCVHLFCLFSDTYYAPAPRVGALSDDARLTSV